MRTDSNLPAAGVGEKCWTCEGSNDVNRYELSEAEKGRMSLSGNEQNHVFLSHSGQSFSDVSGLSGADLIEDSRSFGIFDFDRDGWQDIAITNVNAPLTNLLQNRFKDFGEKSFVAVRLIGGNSSAEASKEWTNRDGFGATVFVESGDMTQKREHRCGEGFASQNSNTMLFGIAEMSQAKSIKVRWPSGEIVDIGEVPSESLVTVFEDASQNKGNHFTIENYVVGGESIAKKTAVPSD